MNYICPSLKKKKKKRERFIEDTIVGFGGFFLYVLTAEKILVINDLGPQYQDLRHMGGRKCSHSAAARALQLLPRFQMQLARVANFLPFRSRSLTLCKCESAENKRLSKVSRMFCKVHCFCFQRAGLAASAISPLCSPSSSLLIGWYAMRCTFEAMGNPEEFFFF